MRMQTFRDPVYKGNFRLFVGHFRQVERFLRVRDFSLKNVGAPRLAKTIRLERDGAHEVVLWFPSDWSPSTAGGAAVLAHEALHATAFVLQSAGIADNAILDEVGTYYIEWLVKEILSRVLRPERRGRAK
jgi:hypothetical protein